MTGSVLQTQLHPSDYPIEFCRLCDGDLDRVARRIQRTQEAYDLTALGRRLVRGRLRYGPEKGQSLATEEVPEHRIRVWDPAAAWHEGDHALFGVPAMRDGARLLVPVVGRLGKIHGQGVTVRLDGGGETRIYGLAARDRHDEMLVRWRQSVEEAVTALGKSDDEDSRIDYVLWRHGEEILSVLLAALRHDPRFIELNGCWFLRSLAVVPSEGQLENLARTMLQSADDPMGAEELVHRCQPSLREGAAGLFGLAMALGERPDLFRNVAPGLNPRWVLAGPPPGTYVARLAAYDPESYAVLCEPGDTLTEDVLRRLWDLDLLATVMGRQP